MCHFHLKRITSLFYSTCCFSKLVVKWKLIDNVAFINLSSWHLFIKVCGTYLVSNLLVVKNFVGCGDDKVEFRGTVAVIFLNNSEVDFQGILRVYYCNIKGYLIGKLIFPFNYNYS